MSNNNDNSVTTPTVTAVSRQNGSNITTAALARKRFLRARALKTKLAFIDALRQPNLEFINRILDSRYGHLHINSRLDGQTPLHYGCVHGHLSLVRLLVERGADVNRTNREGWTPLHLAVYAGHRSIILYLLNVNNPAGESGGSSGHDNFPGQPHSNTSAPASPNIGLSVSAAPLSPPDEVDCKQQRVPQWDDDCS